jgi:hypothetical protein
LLYNFTAPRFGVELSGVDAKRKQHHYAFIRLPANWHEVFPLLRNVWYTGRHWGETLSEEP